MNTPPVPTGVARSVGIVLRRDPRTLGIDPFYVEIIAGMEDLLGASGYSVLLQVVPDREAELEAYERWAATGGVAGVLLADLVENDGRAERTHALGLATVVLGEPATEDITAVRVDNYGAMTDAVGALTALGHTRIARVSGPVDLRHSQARALAFDAAIAAANVAGATVEGDYTEASGAVATRSLIESSPAPTAIIYDNDRMAVGGLDVAHELGVAVPERLSLLAWDDSTACRLATPPLSAMSHDVHALGESVAEALLALIDGRTASSSQAPSPTFIGRGTTAPCPTD
ncbi:LacI family DNA-binding transcriptional regulator [Planctomonas psychrotolerans]|uniref:LacI family DNA-binding transcriptional regulator n=1 Tax=Planctomonas psychrotolerans TaxID=2528712 RepID=UPI0012396A5F|nr:substrate-binding domain-containing protein [Planctomonas psychrotolerans]